MFTRVQKIGGLTHGHFVCLGRSGRFLWVSELIIVGALVGSLFLVAGFGRLLCVFGFGAAFRCWMFCCSLLV